ncbi:choline/ethanolamine kinase-like [Oppia nitens]|uniref:choline/ethanolamine kinase-like n=1 Tax=Oppia nitens TaxID=1686743 RepID=UPI0023DCA362|nr:choline/ethanolamine kinase-like [Oppia nitens]
MGSTDTLEIINNIKNFDEIDFLSMELTRGKTPEDIKERCLQLCQDYIAGDWIRQTVDTIEVIRITGGLTNQLYKCSIIEPIGSTTDPSVVAIRLYGSKYYNKDICDGSERLSDIIIAMMMSVKKLGPELLGVFTGGDITAFYKHRQFKLEEQKNDKLVEELFRKIAQIHAMNVPLKKKHWLLNEIDTISRHVLNCTPYRQLICEHNCETLKTYDIKDEIRWLNQTVQQCGSPMTFTHNDLLSANVMVLEDNNNDNSGDQLLICDYEYASYSYRGLDLSSIIGEWGRLWNDFKTAHNFVDDSTIKQLLNYYIDENIKIFGKEYTENANNSMDQLIKEVKVFALVYKMFMTLIFFKGDDNKDKVETKPTLLVKLAECEYKNYFRLKKQFGF